MPLHFRCLVPAIHGFLLLKLERIFGVRIFGCPIPGGLHHDATVGDLSGNLSAARLLSPVSLTPLLLFAPEPLEQKSLLTLAPGGVSVSTPLLLAEQLVMIQIYNSDSLVVDHQGRTSLPVVLSLETRMTKLHGVDGFDCLSKVDVGQTSGMVSQPCPWRHFATR